MMDLDSAIQHCKEQVQEQAKKGCYSCAEEHQQLAEWLKDYKRLLGESRSEIPNTCGDAISRQAVLDGLASIAKAKAKAKSEAQKSLMGRIMFFTEQLPSVNPHQRTSSSSEKLNKWIPVSERLPDNTDPVSITWVNHDPESYYADIKDKSFMATGHYCNGRWWWYSVTCQDYLDEYGRCDVDAMDDAIEVIAWMPLPESYKAESEEKE